MANEGVVAQMHYDYQDNFLLQISGTKTVLLASPEFMDFLAPYPSLHPLWRQASVSQNISYDTLFEHQQDYLDLEREQGSQGNVKRSVLHKSQAQVEAANAQPMAWNVTLQAGDILFIPSGYLHQVIVGENSISLNAWIPSVFSQFHYRLVNKVALPFLLDDSIDLKLAKLAIIMREVCLFLGDKDNCLVERLAHRYEKVFQSDDRGVAPLEDQRCLLHDITSLCNPLTSLRLAGKSFFLVIPMIYLSILTKHRPRRLPPEPTSGQGHHGAVHRSGRGQESDHPSRFEICSADGLHRGSPSIDLSLR
jgi:hypothetical protein